MMATAFLLQLPSHVNDDTIRGGVAGGHIGYAIDVWVTRFTGDSREMMCQQQSQVMTSIKTPETRQ
jgi:hypothetical protein